MQEVFMDFDDNGNPVISVKGVKGKACKALTADLEKSLGEVITETHTPEYNEREVARDRARNHSR